MLVFCLKKVKARWRGGNAGGNKPQEVRETGAERQGVGSKREGFSPTGDNIGCGRGS